MYSSTLATHNDSRNHKEFITTLYIEHGFKGMMMEMSREFDFESCEEEFLLRMNDWGILSEVDAEHAREIWSLV